MEKQEFEDAVLVQMEAHRRKNRAETKRTLFILFVGIPIALVATLVGLVVVVRLMQ